MDPYLEHPRLWPDVHNRLIAELGRSLGPLVRPRYVIRLEERTYLDEDALVFLGRPDVAVERADHVKEGHDQSTPGVTAVTMPMPEHVHETWLEVRGATDDRVITVLELLSPSNKRPGAGRAVYLEKRRQVLAGRTSLVEIDLLRAGDAMPVHGNVTRSDYRILVSRGDRRPRAELREFSVREPIPRFRLPLRAGDDEPEVDLRGTLDGIYDTASYDLSIDYRGPATPPLDERDAAWADGLLRAAGRR
jgi:hypothetical protein